MYWTHVGPGDQTGRPYIRRLMKYTLTRNDNAPYPTKNG